MNAIEINTTNALRYFGLVLDAEVKDFREHGIKQDTKEVLEEAEKALDMFCDEYYKNDIEMCNRIYLIAYDVANAYAQKGREDGLKAGIGLMVGTLKSACATGD
jgi:pyruvate formate-lyase activating enzyme-like uncharacterized protein